MRHRVACVVLTVVSAGLAIGRPGAQEPAAPATSFEVASVKQNRTGGPSSVRALPNGTLVITNNTAWNIIRNAYGLSGAQVVGAPGWLESDRFDITAKAAAPFTQPEGMALLRTLLVERFGLAAHMDRREMPVYLLSLVRKDGGLGPNLRRVNVDCAALFASVRAGEPMPAPGPNGKVPCSINVRPSTINGAAVSMEQLSRNLVNVVRRMIVDQTGLTGFYDLDLTFAFEPDLAAPGAPPPPSDPSAPSLFTAMQEQLGLKLEPGRAPIDVLVIDRVERPTEN